MYRYALFYAVPGLWPSFTRRTSGPCTLYPEAIIFKMAYTKRKRTYARRRRPLRRRKRGTNLSKTVKRTVNKLIYKAKESKCVCSNLLGLTNVGESTPDFVNQTLYVNVTPGVTDRGRIGNTINATGIRVNYVTKVQFPNTGDYAVEPTTLHMFIIKVKNNWLSPHIYWFKSLDRGIADPYVPLDRENIDDGRRVLNTDMYTVVKHKTVTLQPSAIKPVVQVTGQFTANLRRAEIKFNSNDVSTQGIADLNHVYMFYAYFYTGSGNSVALPINQAARFAVYQYYKD